jgi:hypothetical protein
MGALLKFLLIAAVIVVAYYMYKFRGRPGVLKARMKAAVDAARKVAEDEKTRAAADQAPPKQTNVPVKLVACPKCGTYVAEGKACTCSS